MNRFVALVACTSLSLVCLPSFQPGTVLAAGAVEMQVEHMISLSIDEYNNAMEARDPAGWLKYFTDNVSRNSPLSVQKGKEAFSDYYRWEFKTFRARCIAKKILVSGRSAAVVFLWDAVHKPSGDPLRLEMVGLYEMAASGKFESVSFYYDTAAAAKFFSDSGPAGERR
jgi:ketosteroid isomerase-like protein